MRTLATCVLATVFAGLLGGCGRASDASAADQARNEAGPRILLIYDMEGITDAVRPADVVYGSPTYEATRASLVEDVNAAIRGLLKAGASEVVLADGHGSGNPNPDYILDRLPEGARHDIRDEPYDPYIDTMDRSFAAVVTIAMHSKAGTNGFLAHTYNGHTRWNMGGHDMNESMLVAASAARFGIPLILVTGDDVLQQEIAAFSPETEYVVVKRAHNVEEAVARPRDEVSAEIEAAAERALRNLSRIPPWNPRLPPRFVNHFGYILPEHAAVAINFPGAEVVDNKTVSLETSDFLEAYLAFRGLARFTGYATDRLVLGGIRASERGRELVLQAQQQHVPARRERTFAPTGTDIPRPYGVHGYR
jgi:D-amino peptidase